jgi:hypothetical protein
MVEALLPGAGFIAIGAGIGMVGGAEADKADGETECRYRVDSAPDLIGSEGRRRK